MILHGIKGESNYEKYDLKLGDDNQILGMDKTDEMADNINENKELDEKLDEDRMIYQEQENEEFIPIIDEEYLLKCFFCWLYSDLHIYCCGVGLNH